MSRDQSRQRRRVRQGTLQNRRLEAGKPNRVGRTVLLGTLAVAFALFWLARELELDRDELLGYLRTSLLFVSLLISASVVGAACLWLIKLLIRRLR
jgi:hypothetical protein